MSKPKLAISFSGGRTSAVMTKICLEKYKDTHEILVTFANTGCEHPDTLRFVNACDIHWGFGTVWLEAEVNPEKGVGVRHKVVTFGTASRNGEPFEEVIKKYGIFNQVRPACTNRLKSEVMESFLRSKGFLRGKRINYDTAIGIRADEIDRMSIRRKEQRFVYPLVDEGWTKQMVVEYMKQFDWDLRIPEHLGNCVWCWKKNLRKLLTLAQDHPEVFNFPKKMEEEYGYSHPDLLGKRERDGKRVFFRGYLSAEEILEMAKTQPFQRFDDPNFDPLTQYDEKLDRQTGCNESCEVYPTDGS
jgi:hypothetical protein